MMWCVGFYTDNPEYDSPKAVKDSGGYREGGLEEMCDKGRKVDHMLSTFQCDICHFHNTKGIYQNILR